MIFTGTDKSLLDRAARMLDVQAKALHWDLLVDLRLRRTAKLEFDRLTRDARDLRALGKRINGLVVKVAKPLEKRIELERGLSSGETLSNGGQDGPVTPAG